MSEKITSTRAPSSLPVSISAPARKIIERRPYNFPERSAGNLKDIRINMRASIKPLVQKLLDSTAVKLTEKTIGNVRCLVVQPEELASDSKVLYGYGGGFVTGSAFEDLTIAVPISIRSGLEVIIPEYRLAPEHPWPSACDDMISVYSELSEKISAIIGESAGGNLALVTVLRAKNLRLKLPKSVVLLSPWCNLLNQGDSLCFNEGRDPTLSIHQSRLAAAHYAQVKDMTNPEISPLFGSYDETFPDVFISSGTRDLLLSQSIQLANILRFAGVSVDLQIWDGLWHVFEWDADLPESRLSIQQIVKFLTRKLRNNGT
jgi:acetyl esterase/lipase